jgi:hypothetical protein
MISFVRRMFTHKMTLEIYMKSGNMIQINRVTEYTFNNNSDGVNKLSMTQHNGGRKLLVSTIDLSQIEAVVQVG